MPGYKMIALNNFAEGREADFNHWYDSRHIVHMLDVPGVVAAQRFRVHGRAACREAFMPHGVATPHQRVGAERYGYAALYEIECRDIDEVIADIRSRVGTDRMPLTDTTVPGFLAIFEALGPRREK